MKSDFLIALTQLAAERHLPREQVLQAIEVALASAFKKDNPASGQNISVKLNPNTGEVNVYALKTVVEWVEDPDREISLKDAQYIKTSAGLGDEVAAQEPLPHNASRIAAQTAKQVVLQRLREAERELLYQEFLQHEGDIVSGVIEQTDGMRTITLDLGRAQAILPHDEQVPTERYRKGQRVKVYVLSVRSASKGPEIIVSRSHKDMLKRLFEIEVPEVYSGAVEIKAIAREAGFRSKVAVNATQQGIDPVGSCIGVRGNRIQSIVNELQGEKIDIVSWDEDPRVFIAKALSPSEVITVELSHGDSTGTVVVPDRQLSLAIGKEGQNTRLAARLTGWRLDIKGMTEWEEIREARRLQLAAKQALEREAELAASLAQAQAAAEEAVEEELTLVAADALAETALEPTVEEEAAEVAAAEDVLVPQVDEDEILDALIREDEEQRAREEEALPTFSVDDLHTFTLDEVEVMSDEVEETDDEDEEEDEDLVLSPDLSPIAVLTPDAGKIRFAEDLIEETRGGGRRNGRARRGGANKAKGNRRGAR